ncbi:MAG TPA: type II toxin-antitoxin system RelE/ParE family toxin [Puia sp.]|nr:type II toxin-antitoxin system RelE/ParE family toxin [Puia sp.]
MDKKFIAYRGEFFTVEWYYNSNKESPVLDYFSELSDKQKEKAMYLFKLIATSGRIRSEEKFRNELDQIYAFKPSPDRFLCFFYKDAKIIVTNAYEKKTDKMPPREKEKALKVKADYEKRCKEKSYYE